LIDRVGIRCDVSGKGMYAMDNIKSMNVCVLFTDRSPGIAASACHIPGTLSRKQTDMAEGSCFSIKLGVGESHYD